MKPKPKYSVIIPAKNGMPYLRYSVLSALASNFADLEVIVSLDGSDDESEDFLAGVADTRLRVVRPSLGLSMSEHWDFAQLQATGQWQIFLGQDDLLMNGFTDAFDNLTDAATEKGLDIVVARRAYIAWPPLGDANLKALQYWESAELEIRDSESFVAKALLNSISYHAGPQMYTTTLVSEKLISAIRSKHRSRLVLGHPQDAFLAAALLKEGKHFLFSGKPFSWVGSSIKSAGLAISSNNLKNEPNSIAADYRASVSNSPNLSYNSDVDFSHAVNSRYFIDALAVVWPGIFASNRFQSKLFQIGVDSRAWAVLAQNRKPGIPLKKILYFPGLNLLKMIVGLILIAGSVGANVLRRILGPILSKFASSLNFRSVEFMADPEELFESAMSISTSYSRD